VHLFASSGQPDRRRLERGHTQPTTPLSAVKPHSIPNVWLTSAIDATNARPEQAAIPLSTPG
jgi:hypothetical protein